VDGSWLLDSTQPSESDDQNIANNVLYPSDITPHPATAAISSIGPEATTVAMAGQVPKEESFSAPGAFPETPAKEAESFSVNPIPATGGIGNPIHLAPGEKVPDPSTLTSNTIESTVKTDEASYDKSDAIPGDKDAALFTVPPVSKNMIPESSLPMGSGDATISSVGPTSTTAALAGAVPLESATVPETVTESIEKAHVSPEATTNPEAVIEKEEVEEELKKKVPEAPATSESGVGGYIAGATAAAAAAGTAALAATGSAQDTAHGLLASTTTKATGLVSDVTETAKSYAGAQPPTAPGVPEVVTESITEAHKSPEAAANPEAVKEKEEVEEQFMKKLHEKEEAKEAESAAAAAPPATEEAAPETPAPETPAKETVPETPESSTTAEKKSKRKSIMLKFKKFLK
jgi:hypothetical protein